MAVIDIKQATIKLRDGSTPAANQLEIKLGEGNLTYTETRNREYILDRGRIDSVRDGDEEPMELNFDGMWEEIMSSNGQPLKPEEALKKIAGAASWVSSDPDTCQPYAVDVELETDAECLTDKEREIITFPDFRYESIPHDTRAGTVSFSGSCNTTQAIIEHAAAAKNAAAFNGLNDEYLEAADNAIFPVTTTITWELWIYPETVTGQQGLITKWDDGVEEWAIYLEGSKVRVDVGAAAPAGLGVNYEQSSVDIVAKTWTSLFVTYSAGTVAIWIDGVEDTGSTTTGTIPVTITDTATVVRLGNFVDADGLGATSAYTGRLAEVFIYDAVLAAGVITSLFNEQLQDLGKGLGKAYADRTTAEKADVAIGWDLGETSGTRVAAVGGVNLTDNNTVLYDNGIRVKLAG